MAGARRQGGRAAQRAYADGRRLREAAARRRAMMPRHHPGRYPHPPRRMPPPTWLLLLAPVGLVVFGVLGFAALATVAMLTSLLPMAAMIGVAVWAGGRNRRLALRRAGAAGMAARHLPPHRQAFPPPPPPRPDLVWAWARDRFHALRGEYAAFECDPMNVLRLPALADVTVPSTGRFVEAFAEAQALETAGFAPGPHGAQFVAAVERAERAWRAAREAAERIRLSGLSPAERTTVERVIKLLTTARDSDSDPERYAAYARARSDLAKLDRAGVIHLPPSAMAALEAAARGALPGSATPGSATPGSADPRPAATPEPA